MGRPQRVPERAKSLDLQRDRLSPAYRSRLDAAGERFRRWCSLQGLNLDRPDLGSDDVVAALVAYLQILFNMGVAYWWGLHAVLYAQTEWRHFRGHLAQAWDSVSTWRMHLPVTSRVPLRVELLRALTYAAVVLAFLHDRHRAQFWLGLATTLRMGFYGLLRPKEIFDLFVSDVLVPQPGTHSLLNCCVITIREPKNRSLGGRLQVRMIRDVPTIRWISWRTLDAGKRELFWPYGASQFGRGLRKLLAFTKLGGLGITPSSLRAGGATQLLEAGHSVSHILFAGGWTSEKTLSAYLQLAEAAQTLLRLDPPQALWVQEFVEHLRFLESPPAASFRSLLCPWTPTKHACC